VNWGAYPLPEYLARSEDGAVLAARRPAHREQGGRICLIHFAFTLLQRAKEIRRSANCHSDSFRGGFDWGRFMRKLLTMLTALATVSLK